MGTGVFTRALVQGSHSAAASAGVTPRKGSIDSFNDREFDPKTGHKILKFTIEDQVVIDGVVRVDNYINCVVKDPALVEFFINNQWKLVKMAGPIKWNRDYKSLTLTVSAAELIPAAVPASEDETGF